MTNMNQTAVVTGGGSGLGRELSLELARDGFMVCVTDINEAAAIETVEQMPTSNGSRAYRVDVAACDSVREFAERISELPIRVLINNAGLQHIDSVESFPIEKWKYLTDVMLCGTFAMTQAVLPGMRARDFGRIVNIGSIHSCVASSYKSAYVAAKHGLLGFAKVVALETADVDVTINTICPSYVRTPLVDAQINAQAKIHGISEQEVIETIFLEPMPKKEFITFEEINETVRFLINPRMRNLTGQSIVIDGGWTIR